MTAQCGRRSAMLIRARIPSRQLTLSRIEYPVLGYNVEPVRCCWPSRESGVLAYHHQSSCTRYKMSKVSCPASPSSVTMSLALPRHSVLRRSRGALPQRTDAVGRDKLQSESAPPSSTSEAAGGSIGPDPHFPLRPSAQVSRKRRAREIQPWSQAISCDAMDSLRETSDLSNPGMGPPPAFFQVGSHDELRCQGLKCPSDM